MKRTATSGMSLIEVLLALAILGIGLAVLIQAVSRCLAVVHKTRNYETARYLLQRLAAEHPLGMGQQIAAGAEDGNFDPPNEQFSWHREITPIGLEDEPLFQINTRIAWSNDGGHESAQETMTIVFKPEYMQSGGVNVSR
ncbi:MAG: prepilin-type N-terminal cleavage/methylation domain-containing protein [Verrucomicrobia bacterium]|nr:MAG: prepilin-type N-terminal cleavage/methylation domain-containing protein [Verrucomicrobiota bacterium]